MKWFVTIWLLAAGSGAAFHIVKERKMELAFLNSMEQSLQMLAYYMYQWCMPVEEAVQKMCEQETEPQLQIFYQDIWQQVLEKKQESLGQIWKAESGRLFERITTLKEARQLWEDSFLYFPMEAEAIRKNLFFRAEQLQVLRSRMQEKYQGEQRLVLALGIFSGAFLSLILW